MDLPHLRNTTDDSEVVSIGQRTLQAAVLALDGLELQRAFNQRRHLMRRERFFDVVESATLDGFDRDLERTVCGHYDDLGIRRVALDKTQQLYAVGVRQSQVGENQV